MHNTSGVAMVQSHSSLNVAKNFKNVQGKRSDEASTPTTWISNNGSWDPFFVVVIFQKAKVYLSWTS